MRHVQRYVNLGPIPALGLLAGLLLAVAASAQMRSPIPGGMGNSSTAPDDLSSTAQPGAPVVLVDPGRIYNSKTPTEWVGKSVTLQNVLVQDTNNDGNFWVGSDGGHRILVVKANDPTLSAMTFHKGDIVTISGVVYPASRYLQEQSTASKGSMKDAEKSSGVVLLANQITVASSTQR